MDLAAFLTIRIDFIRQFYDGATASFSERISRIKCRQTPYDRDPKGFNPEDGEPPFLEEALEALESVELIGNMCLGLVEMALKQFLESFLKEIGRALPPTEKGENKDGWLGRYRRFFADFAIDWQDSGVDVTVIEQIVLTRNDLQHAGCLTYISTEPSKHHLTKYPDAAFVKGRGFFSKISVTKEALLTAIDSVDRLCNWLERQRVPAKTGWREKIGGASPAKGTPPCG